jgi:transcriptional regulator with XRE-family HTH domain
MLNGKAIAKLRKFKGYHQKELAAAMGICQQNMSRLEQRKEPVDKKH